MLSNRPVKDKVYRVREPQTYPSPRPQAAHQTLVGFMAEDIGDVTRRIRLQTSLFLLLPISDAIYALKWGNVLATSLCRAARRSTSVETIAIVRDKGIVRSNLLPTIPLVRVYSRTSPPFSRDDCGARVSNMTVECNRKTTYSMYKS